MKKKGIIYFTLFFLCFLTSCFSSHEYIDFNDLDLTKDSTSKTARIVDDLQTYSSTVVAFALTNSVMTSEIFCDLTKKLTLKEFSKLKILDISDNKIDEKAAPVLANWLRLNSKPYIKITGTPIALKNVEKLYKSFNELYPNEAATFMKNIIFMSRDYINKASKTVKIYKTLVSQKAIPQNWAEIHNKFYELDEYKNLLRQRDFTRYHSTMVNMQRLSISPLQKPQEQDLYESVYDEESFIDFNDALESISPTPTPTRTPTNH